MIKTNQNEEFPNAMGMLYEDIFGEVCPEAKDELECEKIGLIVTECFPDGASQREVDTFGEYQITAPNGRSLGALWSTKDKMYTDGSNIYPSIYRAALERWKKFDKYIDNKQVVIDICYVKQKSA